MLSAFFKENLEENQTLAEEQNHVKKLMLRFYTNRGWLLPGKTPTVMMHPFFGFKERNLLEPDDGRFDDYYANANAIFEESSPEGAQIVVFPAEFSRDESTLSLFSEAQKFALEINKPLLVFYNADDDQPIQGQNLLIYRTSFYASTKGENEFAVPGWSVDFADRFCFGKIPVKEQSYKPSVAYCGYVDYVKSNFKTTLKSLIGRRASYAERLRGKAIRNLLSDSRIACKFLIRDGFWAEGIQDKMEARRQYALNMASADYAFICRGGGNFSYRLYEAMSLGRVPLMIDTDGVLPFEEVIDWNSFLVRIPQDRIEEIGSRLMAFHCEKSKEEFHMLQEKIRETYLLHISPTGFFKTLSLKLKHQV